MNVTFLIGNGFDLACGLKSSYPDVYEEYIKTESKTEVIKKFKQDLIDSKSKEKWGNWSDFEMGMAEYAKNFNNENELIECVSDFKAFLESYLAQEERRLIKDFKVIKRDFKKEIDKFIGEDIHDFYLGITKNIEIAILSLTLSQSVKYTFINFNYTSLFKEIAYNSLISQKEIIHIHGDLDSHDVVLGADNIEQVKTNFIISNKGKRVFIKPFLNEQNDSYKVRHVKHCIEESNCICLFGLSLGDSDLTWKKEIVNWLKKDTKHHLFIYDYECSKIDIEDIGLKLNAEEDYKEKYITFFGLEGTNEFNEQIHIPIGKKIFEIYELLNQYKTQAKIRTA